MSVIPVLLFLSVLAACAGGFRYLYLDHQRTKRQQAEETRRLCLEFRAEIPRQIRKQRGNFSFAGLVDEWGISRHAADSVAAEVYRSIADRAAEDGVITEEERVHLDKFAQTLEIDPQTAAAIQQTAREDRYQRGVTDALADGSITQEENRSLRILRRSLGLGRETTFLATQAISQDAYLAAFRRIALDGVISREDREELARYREALGIADERAATMIRGEAMKLFKRSFAEVVQDGGVTDDDEASLRWLQSETGLSNSDLGPYFDRIVEVKRLAGYRDGDLPVHPTTKLLEGGETCHWNSTCFHVYETPAKRRSVEGEIARYESSLRFHRPDPELYVPSIETHGLGYHP